MAVLAIDLGATKLAIAVVSEEGTVITSKRILLDQREGAEVGTLIIAGILEYVTLFKETPSFIRSAGISVPGIAHQKNGRVWAPNIPGWDDYPLLEEVMAACTGLPVALDSDRACYIMGETWKGKARGKQDAIFLAVGTGIGAGIMVDGKVLRGAHDIAGAIGWMALQKPYDPLYQYYGCFEYHASGDGITRMTNLIMQQSDRYEGILQKQAGKFNASDVFKAFSAGDPVATQVMKQCIEYWGMAVANLVSLFNPEMIILGGGVFGPAEQFLEDIKIEAAKWAQPVSVNHYSLEISSLGGGAGIFGAAYMALQQLGLPPTNNNSNG